MFLLNVIPIKSEQVSVKELQQLLGHKCYLIILGIYDERYSKNVIRIQPYLGFFSSFFRC